MDFCQQHVCSVVCVCVVYVCVCVVYICVCVVYMHISICMYVCAQLHIHSYICILSPDHVFEWGLLMLYEQQPLHIASYATSSYNSFYWVICNNVRHHLSNKAHHWNHISKRIALVKNHYFTAKTFSTSYLIIYWQHNEVLQLKKYIR